MLRNIRLILAYDGTAFHGWQFQPGLRTVQETVEQAVRRVVRHQVAVVGASRTDAGVHARGQVAHFRTTHQMPVTNLRRAIGGRLPKDVSLIHTDDVPLGFHASRDPTSKLYRYTIHADVHRPVETLRQAHAYHCWNALDTDRMQAAADMLVGEHDFAGFATSGSQRLTTVRRILRLEVRRRYQEVSVDVEGTGFLYNMVRNIVGTLIEVGRGHWPPERMQTIIAGRDRSQAGPTAPARGLCLEWIRYDLPALRACPPPAWVMEEDLGTVEGEPSPDPTPPEESP